MCIKKITPYDIASIFNKAYIKVATIEKAVSGFEKSGICPLQPNKIGESDFTAAHEIPETVIIQEEDGENEFDQESSHVSIVPAPKTNVPSSLPHPHDPVPSTSSDSCHKQQSIPMPDLKAILNDVSPIPLAKGTVERKKNIRKGHSAILTGTPMKQVYQQNEIKRKQKEEEKSRPRTSKRQKRDSLDPKRQNKIGKKNIVKHKKETKSCRRKIKFAYSSTEDDTDIDETTICDDNEDDDAFAITEENTEVCIICGEFGNNEL